MASGLQKKLPYEDITMESLVLVKTNIAGYFFDGFLEVSHNINTVVTTHPVQQGANVSDHAYVEPVEVTMTVKMSDAMRGMVEEQFTGISYTRSTAAYRILRQLQEQRLVFQIHTRLETLQNMMITNISVDDDYENQFGLECKVTMKEVIVAKEKAVKISTRENTTTTHNTGTVQANTSSITNDSFLQGIMSAFNISSI